MTSTELILSLLGTSAATAVLTSLLNRKKEQAKTDETVVNMFKSLAVELKSQIEDLRKEAVELKKENADLRTQINQLKQMLSNKNNFNMNGNGGN